MMNPLRDANLVPSTLADRRVREITIRMEARPFFADLDGGVPVAPPDGLEPPTRTLGRCRSIH